MIQTIFKGKNCHCAPLLFSSRKICASTLVKKIIFSCPSSSRLLKYFATYFVLVLTTNAYASKWLAPSVKFMAHTHWKKTWESGISMSPLEKKHCSKPNIFNSTSVWMVRLKCSIVWVHFNVCDPFKDKNRFTCIS